MSVRYPRGIRHSFNATTDPWEALDGRLNAPTGTPQFPTILNGYVSRPPWRVSGVDYRTGINTGVTLKTPGVDSPPANVNVDLGNKFFDVVGTTTIDGWDFSGGGGWQVLVHSGNLTIRNCRFAPGLLKWLSGESGNGGTIEYCEFDSTSLIGGAAGSLSIIQRPGVYTIRYNYWLNSSAMHLQISDADVGTTYDIRFNTFAHAGLGNAFGAHGDIIQLFGGGQVDSLINRFNLVNQNSVGASTQGWSFNRFDPKFPNSGFTEYCTHILKTDINYVHIFNATQQFNQYFIRNNYADLTSLSGDWLNTTLDGEGVGPFAGTVTQANNINMVTGGTI